MPDRPTDVLHRRSLKAECFDADTVSTFADSLHNGGTIYVLSLLDFSQVSKIGMTRDWVNRSRTYENLGPLTNGIDEFVTYRFTDRKIDLRYIEYSILRMITIPRRRGKEWVSAPFECTRREVERALWIMGHDYCELYGRGRDVLSAVTPVNCSAHPLSINSALLSAND